MQLQLRRMIIVIERLCEAASENTLQLAETGTATAALGGARKAHVNARVTCRVYRYKVQSISTIFCMMLAHYLSLGRCGRAVLIEPAAIEFRFSTQARKLGTSSAMAPGREALVMNCGMLPVRSALSS